MFKNENSAVMNKAQKKYKELPKQRPEMSSIPKKNQTRRPKSKSLTSESATFSQTRETALTVSRPVSPIKPLISSIEDQALGFFAANNLMQPSIALRGNYQWLFQMLSGPEVDPSVKSSTYAVSLATLATATKSEAVMEKAHEHYALALASTNKALGDSKKLYEDDTIVSVILLGVYENVMFEKHSLHAWMQHLKGASTLLHLRGAQQFKTALGRQIFVQYYRTVVNAGIEIGIPIPENIVPLYQVLINLKDYTTHGVEHQVQVLTKAISVMQNTAGNPVTVVSDVLKLVHELDSMHFFLQTLWRYEVVYMDKPAEHVFGTFYHIYLNSWVVSMWNILRTCRVRLFKILRIQVNKGLRHYPPLFSVEDAEAHIKTCEEVIRTQILAICASTPQLTGQVAFPHQVKEGLKGGVDSVDLHHKKFTIHPQDTFLEPFKATGLDHLIGPLYEVGRSDYGPELTEFVVHQLLFIARKIGTRQAILLAEELKEKLKQESAYKVWNDPCPSAAQLAALATEGVPEA
ncbi:hypothetical protein N0V90_003223 [Kalmusia sp. IMI 367209]|nr:hypothetical protein N0V90_003223 [Kalmusia sp. IMI 367209]